MILVTGATGTVGSEVVKRLSAHGIKARAITRDLRKVEANSLPHIEFVQDNFDDAESMRPACSGVDRAFLLTNSTERAEEQQIAFVRVAERSGLRHIMKLSQLHCRSEFPAAISSLPRRGRSGDPSRRPHVHISAAESLHAGPAELPAEHPAEERFFRPNRRRAHQRGGCSRSGRRGGRVAGQDGAQQQDLFAHWT